MGRSFAFEYKSHLYQAPVGYYTNRRSWDLAPGYEHDSRPDLTRPITPECLFCHATRASLEPGTLNRYQEIVAGVQCARCHGEPVDHANLVNPRKLAARRRDSICEQCHLSGEVRIAQPARRVEDFRPGADLSEYIEVFTATGKGVAVNGQPPRSPPAGANRLQGKALVWNVPQSPPTNRELRRDLPDLPRCTAQFFRLRPVPHAKSKGS
jgi:hypothetical protein